MGYGITRDEAMQLLHEYIKNENMIKHCLASEAVMMELAKRLGEDEEKWGLAGLLHDLDVELKSRDLCRYCSILLQDELERIKSSAEEKPG